MKKLSLTVAVIFCLFALALADEGMFLVNDIPKKIKGLKLKPKEIYNPDGVDISDAVIIVDGGTGSFVSPRGLILTNHHVAFGAIQRNSTAEHNYLEEGFYARTLEEELPAPGYEAYITLNFKDITEDVLSVVKEDMTPEERAKAIQRRIAEIEKENENKEEGTEGRVVSMFDGMYYYLFTYLKIKDIRLVYAPPSSIGNYGGEIDNWMWPRHTGDFSFLRAYVGPDGKPAEYSEDNVPFKPGKYLAFSSKGIKEGDLVFILGYPGSTMRYRTSCSVDWNQNISYPFRIKLFKSIIDMLEEESKKSPEVKIKLSSFIKGLSNAMKNNQGMIDGFKKTKLLQRKLREEEKLMEWVNRNPEIKKEYGKVLDEIKALYKEHKKNVKRDMILQYITLIPTVRYATTIQEWSIEKSKPEAERKPEYMDYRIPQLKKNFEIGAQNYYPPADKKLFRLFLDLLMELPQEERPEFINKIAGNSTESEKNIQTFIDSLFENTKITDHEMRMKMLDMTADELNKLNDPFIKFAEELNKELEKIEKKNYYFSGKITQLRPKYYKLLKLWKKEEMYPDANRTLRFTYGYVKGYSPRDAVYYRYITKLKGVIEKHTGEEPFNAPGKLIELYQEKDYGKYMDKRIKDVPVNFLATTDITGGNSGSPVFNGKGEIVGCAFDGNYEAMTSDWQFDDNLTRTIAVDSRYILFILDKFSNAKELLNELTIH